MLSLHSSAMSVYMQRLKCQEKRPLLKRYKAGDQANKTLILLLLILRACHQSRIIKFKESAQFKRNNFIRLGKKLARFIISTTRRISIQIQVNNLQVENSIYKTAASHIRFGNAKKKRSKLLIFEILILNDSLFSTKSLNPAENEGAQDYQVSQCVANKLQVFPPSMVAKSVPS